MQGISEQQIATLATRIAARATLFAALGTDVLTTRPGTPSMRLPQTLLTSDGAYRLLANAAANWLTQTTASTSPAHSRPSAGASLPLETLVQALREVFTTDSQRRAIDQAHDRLSQQLPVILERIASFHGLPASVDAIAVWLMPLLHRRTQRNKARTRSNKGAQDHQEREAADDDDSMDDASRTNASGEVNALLDVVSWLEQAAYADEYSNRPAARNAHARGAHLSEYA